MRPAEQWYPGTKRTRASFEFLPRIAFLLLSCDKVLVHIVLHTIPFPFAHEYPAVRAVIVIQLLELVKEKIGCGISTFHRSETHFHPPFWLLNVPQLSGPTALPGDQKLLLVLPTSRILQLLLPHSSLWNSMRQKSMPTATNLGHKSSHDLHAFPCASQTAESRPEIFCVFPEMYARSLRMRAA